MTEKPNDSVEIGKKLLSRRNFLKGAGALSMSLAGLDYFGPEFMYDKGETRVEILSQRNANKINTLFLGGFGTHGGETPAETLGPVFIDTSNVLVGKYWREGLEIPKMAQQFTDTCEAMGITDIIIYAHSMGGTITLNMLPYLQQLRIKKIIFNSSPFTANDVKDNQTLAEIWAKSHYPGGPITQSFAEAKSSQNRGDVYSSIVEQGREIVRRATTGVSPRLKSSQIQLLYDTNPYNLQSYLSPDTEFYYLCAADFNADDTVMLQTAIPEWQKFLPGELQVMMLPNTGHANPGDCPEEYLKAAYRIMKPHEFYAPMRRKK